MDEREYQKKNLSAIFSGATLAPVFRRNAKNCFGKFADLIPYIAYNYVMNYKYIIRARPQDEFNSFDAMEREIIVEYNSIDDLVNDGWELD